MAKTSNMYKNLKQALNTDTERFGEVGLFRRMLEYFNGNPACTMLETHQKYVKYDNDKKCEISDLLIVNYSTMCKCMKLTFLQAKCAKRDGYGFLNGEFKFILDTKQYQLLRERPIMNPLNTGLNPNILHDASSPAITSYGVFYKNGSGMDFGFEVTDWLRPTNGDMTTGSKTCYFRDVLNHHGCYPWWKKHKRRCILKSVHCSIPLWCAKKPCCRHDLFSTIDVNCFESAIANFEIGSPICAECANACQPMRDIAGCIFSSIKAVSEYEKNNGVDMSAFKQFEAIFRATNDDDNNRKEWRKDIHDYDGGDRIGREEIEITPFAAKNILLINADEYEFHEHHEYNKE